MLARPVIPATKTSVFVDMEGDANARSIYLIGAGVVSDNTSTFHSSLG